MREPHDTVDWVDKFIDRMREIASDLHYAVDNIYFYNVPEEYKPHVRDYLAWLRMKILHLVEEVEFELKRLEEKLWEVERGKNKR